MIAAFRSKSCVTFQILCKGRDYQTFDKFLARNNRQAIRKITSSIGTNTLNHEVRVKSSQTKYPLISLPETQIGLEDKKLGGNLRSITDALTYDIYLLNSLHDSRSKTNTVSDIIMAHEVDELQRLTKNLTVALEKLYQMIHIERNQEDLSKQKNTLLLVTHLSNIFERISTLVQLLTSTHYLRIQKEHQQCHLMDVFNFLDEVLNSSIELMTNCLHNVTKCNRNTRKANLFVIKASSTACESSMCLQGECLESGDMTGKPLGTEQTENTTSSGHGTISNAGSFSHRYLPIKYFRTQLEKFTNIFGGLSAAEQSYKLMPKFQQMNLHPLNSMKYLRNIPLENVIASCRKVPLLTVALMVALMSFGLVFAYLLYTLPVIIYRRPYNTIQISLSSPFEKSAPRGSLLTFFNMLHSKLTRYMISLNYPTDSPPV
ncbi:hypothetical protein P879_04247 [Paragonimus westermani]|uniref:Uncharacterized protein n=1 Tax=Paragonimus westermani TaxID=34504 RepID=A0A8T0D2K1_9TREM|nr:hypothetical protein P879_04247 [Paragonimus westermani]